MPSDQQKDLRISVILPVYKNRDSLVELYARLVRVLEENDHSFELIFINDACPQFSLQILKEFMIKDARVKVIAMANNVGQHLSVLTGLKHAVGEWHVVLDADLQDPPEGIQVILDAAQKGAKIVFAGRTGKYQNISRRVTSLFYKQLLGLISNIPVDAGMFFVIHHSIRDKMLEQKRPTPMVTGILATLGEEIVTTPVNRAVRIQGKSAYSAIDRLQVGFRVLASVINWQVEYLAAKMGFDININNETVQKRIRMLDYSLLEPTDAE